MRADGDRRANANGDGVRLGATIGLALAVTLAPSGCAEDEEADTAAMGTSATDMTATDTTVTEGTGPLGDPYGFCGDADAPTPCDDEPSSVASCAERTKPGGSQLYRVCEPACAEQADCPVGDVGNASPQCVLGRCVLACNPDANVCPAGTVCVDGMPAQCMWPVDAPAAHADVESFCATACGPCGATLLLPWTGDCATECATDLADCDAEVLDEVFACTGGEGCPNGGGAVAQCLGDFACVQGSG